MLQQVEELVALLHGRDSAQLEDAWPGCQDAIHQLPVPVEAELEEIGEDQVGERTAVALELLGRFNVVQVFLGRLLGLNVADDAVLAVPHPKIWVAGLGLLGEGGDVNLASVGGGSKPLQERFQAGVETLLPRVPLAGDVGDGFEVVR